MLRRLRPLGLLLLWLIVIAALLEIGLRLAVAILPPRLAISARWVITGQPYAETWTPAWQENIDHYYALRPGLENALQYGSANVSFRLSTIELWQGGGIGFRNRPVDYFVDAVVVGDSFGLCFTEQDDCWVNILERDAKMGIVNLSQPVTGTTSHARILKSFGEPLQPPLVIWQFFGNDFNDDYGLAVYRKEIEKIEDTNTTTQAPSLIDWLRTHSAAFAVIETALTGRWYGLPERERVFEKPYRVEYGDHLLLFGGLYEQQAMDMMRPQNQIGLDYSRKAFLESQQLVETWDGKLVVLLIPTREEVYQHITTAQMGEDAMQTLRSAREAMFALCDELSLTCFDLLPGLQEHALLNEVLYYEDDMHLNPHGNAVVADLLRNWLVEGNLLSED